MLCRYMDSDDYEAVAAVLLKYEEFPGEVKQRWQELDAQRTVSAQRSPCGKHGQSSDTMARITLGCGFNALHGHQMARITSGCG